MFIIIIFLIGCIIGIYEAIKPIERQETTETTETQNNTPYYIMDELEILRTNRRINNELIKELEKEVEYTFKKIDVLKLEKKINDLDIKNNKINAKIEKIKEKWGI